MDRILIRQLLFAAILMKNIVKRSRAHVRYCYSLSLIDTKDKMKEALIIKCPQKPEQRWIGS